MTESRHTYRAAVIEQVASELKQTSLVPNLLAKLYARMACGRCNRYGPCDHRDRAGDMEEIQRAARRLG